MSSISYPALADPEVLVPASRNRKSRADRLRIVREADACAHGDLGPLLRKEGIYSSSLKTYRKQFADGKLSEEAVEKKTQDRRVHAATIQSLTRQLAQSEKRARKFEALLELQKKVAELFEQTMEPLDR